jgi:hypothetical protein
VNPPIARQSRPVRGWKKLAANTANSTVFSATSGHRPYAEPPVTPPAPGSRGKPQRWPSPPPWLMPRIISAIISVQPTAATRKPGLATPVATRMTASTSIGMQQAIIIQP